MELLDRVPFELAIKGEKLFKKRFESLSKPQQVVLKAFYGLQLNEEELVHWSMLQGGATYDELGYVKSVTMVPYIPKEYRRLVAVLGRRSGKTDMLVSTAAAYEATLGGHKKYVKPNQQFKALFFAQSKGDAEQNMNFIRLALQESPMLSSFLGPEKDWVASEIRLTNGLIVEPVPVGKAIGRGHAVPIVIMDEAAFWYTDPNAANPDFEVLRAVTYSQLQFPNSKIFIPSTPWAEQGILFQAWKAGTEGRKLQCEACKRLGKLICEHPLDARERYSDTLVVHASTAAMENPLISRKRLVEIRRDDPEAFPRESLAMFIKSISGWLNKDKVAKAIDAGVYEREAITEKNALGRLVPSYAATMDPAFRKDSFAFTICHHDDKLGIVQDYVKYWEPQPGIPLKPGDVLDDIKVILDQFDLSMVYSDQHQLESLQQLAMDRGFVINGYDFTGTSKGKITGSFKVIIDQERIRLLDHELQKDQLESLQRFVLQSGNVRIAAPPRKHDDLAMALILNARMVMWLKSEAPEKPKHSNNPDKDHLKMGISQIERKRDEAFEDQFKEENDYD